VGKIESVVVMLFERIPPKFNEDILLSILKEHSDRIFNGSKHFELRKIIPKNVPRRVFVYEAEGSKSIVGHFVVDQILSGLPPHYGSMSVLPLPPERASSNISQAALTRLLTKSVMPFVIKSQSQLQGYRSSTHESPFLKVFSTLISLHSLEKRCSKRPELPPWMALVGILRFST
jgi:hypothetical protein